MRTKNPPRHSENGTAIDPMIRDLGENFRTQIRHCEDRVRQSPMSAVLAAAFAGYVLRSFPIFALFFGFVRLLTALLRPALFIYGLTKVARMITTPTERSTSRGAGG